MEAQHVCPLIELSVVWLLAIADDTCAFVLYRERNGFLGKDKSPLTHYQLVHIKNNTNMANK